MLAAFSSATAQAQTGPTFGSTTIPTQTFARNPSEVIPLTFPVATGGTGTITHTLEHNGNTPLPLQMTYNANGGTTESPPTLASRTGQGANYVDAVFTYTATDTAGMSASLPFRIIIVPNGPTFGDQTLADLTYARGQVITPLTLPRAFPSSLSGGYTAFANETNQNISSIGLFLESPEIPDLTGNFQDPVVLSGAILDTVPLGRQYFRYRSEDNFFGAASQFRVNIVVVDASAPYFADPLVEQFFNTDVMGDVVLSEASGGTTPYTFTLDGVLPDGLEFAADTRTLSGTPTAAAAGTTTLGYTVRDANGMEASRNFDVTVGPLPSFDPSATVPDLVYARHATDLITPLTFPVATGGSGKITYSLAANRHTVLPGRMIFSANGGTTEDPPTLVGSPNVAVDTVFTYTATDRAGVSVFLPFRITITGQPSFGDAMLAEQTYARGQTIPPLTFPEASLSHLVSGYGNSRRAGNSIDDTDLTFHTRVVSFLFQAPVLLQGTVADDAPLGQYNYVLRASDLDGRSINFDWSMVVVEAASLVFTGFFPERFFMADEEIEDLVLPEASGGTEPYTFSLQGVPAGLEFAADTRTLSGTPSTAGASTLTYTVRDADGTEVRLNVAVTVSAPLTFGSATIADQSYARMEGAENAITPLALPAASGGRGGIVYSLASTNAQLPDEMAFNTHFSPPTITGVPNQGVDAEFTYTATDSTGMRRSLRFRLTISGPPSFGDQVLAEQTYAQGQTIALTLPQATPAANVEHYFLPPALGTDLITLGLLLDSSEDDGADNHQPPIVISGTIATSATTGRYSWEQHAVGKTASPGTSIFFFSIVVVPEGLQFIPPTVAEQTYTADAPISDLVLPRALSGTTPYTFTLDGAPDGLEFDADTRTLSGTPTTMGDSELTYTLRDAADAEVSLTFALTVLPAELIFDPATQADQTYTVGTAIPDLTLPGNTGGTEPFTFTLSGAPDDLEFDADTRILSGRPTAEGESSLTYKVRDAADIEVSLTFNITILPVLISLAFEPAMLADQTYAVGDASTELTLPDSIGGSSPYTFTLGGAPDGLSFTADTRTLSGTPTAEGESSLTFTVRDAADTEVSLSFALTALPTGLRFAPATQANQTYNVGSAITDLVLPNAASGTSPYTFTLEGAPDGLSFTADTRTLSGTPSEEGVSSLTYTVRDANDIELSLTFTATVNAAFPLTFDPATQADQTYEAGTAITDLILPNANNGTTPYTFTLEGAPDGLTYTADTRTLSGTPTTEGDSELSYTVRDADGTEVSLTFAIRVDAAPLAFDPATQADQIYTAGTAITDLTLPDAIGGTSPYTFTLSGAPDGLSFDADTRTLSGMPAADGNFALAYTVRDAEGAEVSLHFAIRVNISISTFGFGTATIADQTYARDADIGTVTFPVASNGSGTITYTLVSNSNNPGPVPSNLVFTATANPPTLTGAAITGVDTVFTYTATDEAGGSASLLFRITVTGGLNFGDQTVAEQTYVQGQAIDPLTLPEVVMPPNLAGYSVPNVLTGLSIATGPNTSSGFPSGPLVLQGTVDASASTGRNTISVGAFDTGGRSTFFDFIIVILPAGAVYFDAAAQNALRTTTDDLVFSGGEAVNLTLPEVSGGTGSISYTLVDETDAIPGGLSFSATDRTLIGQLSSVPDRSTFNLSYTATDTNSMSVVFSFSLTVVEAVSFNAAAETVLGVATEGLTFLGGEEVSRVLPAASGGVGSISYTLLDEDGANIESHGLTYSAADRSLAGQVSSSDERITLTYTASTTIETATLIFPITLQASAPAFTPAAVAAQEYKIGIAVALTLPEASNAVDDAAAFDYTLSEDLESSGLTFSATERTLSGIPTAVLDSTELIYTATEQSLDYGGGTSSLKFNLSIILALKFTPETVADQTFMVDVALDPPLTLPVASEGTAEYTYTLGGAIPDGLAFDPDTRVLSGTPSAAGNALTLTFGVVDADTNSLALEFNVEVAPNTLAFADDVAIADQSYTATAAITTLTLPPAMGGIAPLAYTLSSTPPAGLSFADATDTDPPTLSGTPDAETASTEVVYTVTDSATVPRSATLTFNLFVAAMPVLTQDALTYTAGFALQDLPTPPTLLEITSGGVAPISYTLGGLPTGLSFDPTSRVLTGTVDTAGSSELTFDATDSNNAVAVVTFTLTINAPLIFTEQDGAAHVRRGETYRTDPTSLSLDPALTLPAFGGGDGTYTATLTGPAEDGGLGGLDFDAASRVLSGTLDSTGDGSEFVWTVTDGSGASFTLIFMIRNAGPYFEISQEDLIFLQDTQASLTLPAANTLQAQPNAASVSYTLRDASDATVATVFPGLAFDPATRIIAGAPTSLSNQVMLTYTVSDGDGNSEALTFNMLVDPAPLVLSPAAVAEQSYTVGRAIASLNLPTASGGIKPYTYTLGGDIPSGLSFDPASPTLSGKPAEGAEGDHSLTFTVRDSASVTVNPIVFLVNIDPPPPLTLNPATVPEQSYTIDETIDTLNLPLAAGGIEPYAYTLTGVPRIPAGLIFTATSNPPALSGTPGAGPEGDHQLVYTVSDAASTPVTASLTFAVNVELLPLVLTPDTVPNQTYTVSRDITPLPLPVASGGAKPYSYALSDVPAGLNFNATSNPPTLSGKPTTEGEHQMTFSVTDSNLPSATTTSLSFTISVLSSTKENLIQVNEVLLPEIARAMADQHVDAVSRRISEARTSRDATGALGGQNSWAGLLHTHGLSLLDGKQLDSKELLRTSHFVLPLQSRSQLSQDAVSSAAQSSSALVLWGDAAHRKMSDEQNNVEWDGDVTSVHLGLDALISKDLLAGFAVSQSRSEMNYQLDDVEGIHELDMTGVYPYFGWSGGRLNFWGTIGIGQGELEILDNTITRPTTSDVDMWTLGLGGRAAVFNSPEIAIHLRGDALQTRLEVDDSDDTFITASETEASRVRFAMEATRIFNPFTGVQIKPTIDMGLRYDGGDGDERVSFEMGAAVRHTRANLSIEGRIHTLIGRDNYSEWGAHAALQLVAAGGKGLSLNLTSNYGAEATPDVRQIWQRDLDLDDRTPTNNNDISLKARLGYGIPTPTRRHKTLLTPYAEFTQGPTPQNTLGLQWQLPTATTLQLEWINQQDEAPKTQLEAKLHF